MPFDRHHFHADVAQALAHPIRLRILDLFTCDPIRPLTASTFFRDLSSEFDDITLSQIRYHLVRLQDAELLPAERRGGSDRNHHAMTRRRPHSRAWDKPSRSFASGAAWTGTRSRQKPK
ncbi:MAG: helix-turn-helix domain-containing protein [Solirubrobacterales bacterium]